MSRNSKETPDRAWAKVRLDAIYNSPDPAVKQFMSAAMHEEYALADDRVLKRVAMRFAHLLPPKQQQRVQIVAKSMAESMAKAM